LRDTNDWILLSLVGKESPSTDEAFARYSAKAMTKKGRAFMKRKWWLPGLGDNELAEYDKKVEVWVSRRHNIPKKLLDDLESQLNSSSAKDIPHNGAEDIEGRYWAGMEAGLMGILFFSGLIYANDGSQEKKTLERASICSMMELEGSAG